MIFIYLAALLAPIITLIFVAMISPKSKDGSKLPPWPEWNPARVRIAVLLGAAAVALSLVRLQFQFTPGEDCSGSFANAMNSSFAHGTVYFDAIYLLSIPLMVIAVLRRDARWGLAALLLMIVSFAACLEATKDFRCPGFP